MRSRTSPPLQAHALEALPTRQHVHTYAAASSHVVTLSLPRRRRVFSFFFKRHMHTESIRSSLTLSHSPFLSLLSYHPLAPSLSLSLSLSLTHSPFSHSRCLYLCATRFGLHLGLCLSISISRSVFLSLFRSFVRSRSHTRQKHFLSLCRCDSLSLSHPVFATTLTH